MDLKTLEYMEKRASEARAIVNTIERLRKNIEKAKEVEHVKFMSYNGNRLFDTSKGSLTNEMKEAYIKAAENEIGALEQKLAEL